MSEKTKTLGIQIAGLVFMAICSYVAVRTANRDVVVEVLFGLCMGGSIAVTIWGIVRTVKHESRFERAQRETEAMRTQLQNCIDKLGAASATKLILHSASWGNATTGKSALEALRGISGDGLVFWANNELLGPDPVKGPGKTVQVDYSYEGIGQGRLERPEGSCVVVPEDPWLKSENDRLAEEVKCLKDQLEPLKKNEAEAIAKQQRDAETLKNAPRLFIEHKHDGNRDVLMLRNDKDEDARYIGFDPLNALIKHTISPSIAMPAIEGGGPVKEIPIEVYNGATGQSMRLWELLNEHHMKTVETVRVYYQGKSAHFYRNFTLKQNAPFSVTWEPGPVCLSSATEG